MRRESGSADELDEEGSELASRTFIDTRVAFDGSEMYWGVSSTLAGGADFGTLDEVSEGFEGGSVSGIASVTGFDTGATSGTVASVLMGKFGQRSGLVSEDQEISN